MLDRYLKYRRSKSKAAAGRRCAGLAAGLILLSACGAEEPAVTIGGERFSVEIADDDKSRTLGLMFREKLLAHHGMLFIFADEEPRAFWMKNTKIPLDILYFDRDFKLVSVSADARPCFQPPCRSYPSAAPAMYVLELPAGEAARLGLKLGDPLLLHNIKAGKKQSTPAAAESDRS